MSSDRKAVEALTGPVPERDELAVLRAQLAETQQERDEFARKFTLAQEDERITLASLAATTKALEEIRDVDPDEWAETHGWICVEFLQTKARAALSAAGAGHDCAQHTVTGDEGTAYCARCEQEARAAGVVAAGEASGPRAFGFPATCCDDPDACQECKHAPAGERGGSQAIPRRCEYGFHKTRCTICGECQCWHGSERDHAYTLKAVRPAGVFLTPDQAAQERRVTPAELKPGDVIVLDVFSTQFGYEREQRTVVAVNGDGTFRLREGDREYDSDLADYKKRRLALLDAAQQEANDE